MEEIKYYYFTEFNRTNILKANTTKNNKRINIQLNMLLTPEELGNKNKIKNQFYSNKTNFFKSKNVIKLNRYNKTDIKFPIIKIKKKNSINNRLYKTVNDKKQEIIKSNDNNIFNRIFKDFQIYNQKYNDITRYFKSFIVTGNNNPKMHIKNINNFKHVSSLTKPKSRKYCFNAFQRIKNIK